MKSLRLETHFYLINIFRAVFLLKWHLNLPIYYKVTCRNYGYLKSRHCLIRPSKRIFLLCNQYFCSKVLRKQYGPQTNKKRLITTQIGKTVVNLEFLRTKTQNLAQSLKKFARRYDRMVALFRNSVPDIRLPDIRQLPDRSGPCQIKIRRLPDQNQAAA